MSTPTPFSSPTIIISSKKAAIRNQSSEWSRQYGIKLKRPMRPIDKLLKEAGIKTMGDHFKEKTCFSCHKIANLEKMNEIELREYNISAMCKSCQDDFFKI